MEKLLLITDVDGTLFDTHSFTERKVKEIIEREFPRLSRRIDEALRMLHKGRDVEEVVSFMGLSPPERGKIHNKLFSALKEGEVVPLRGVQAAVRVLARRGATWAIATNNRLKSVQHLLRTHSLYAYFHRELIFCRDNFSYVKPSPEIGWEALARAEKEHLIVLGDGNVDVEFAYNLRCPCVLLMEEGKEGSVKTKGWVHVVSSWHEIPDKVAHIYEGFAL